MAINVLVAPDKFRGSLESSEVCHAIKNGVLAANPQIQVETMQLADGGEGTVNILVSTLGGSIIEADVLDPLGRPIKATYGLSKDSKLAFIEMAAASGLALLEDNEYNPLLTSTFGTGQLIVHAIENGAETIYLGIGGSATTDAGLGMARALGYKFLNNDGEELDGSGGCLEHVATIHDSDTHPSLPNIQVVILSDVTNPLFGRNGAAWVYGPQKGADNEMVEKLDIGLRHINKVVTEWRRADISQHSGAGAAGGLGAGGVWFLNAQIRGGVDTIIELTGLKEKIRQADLVITGEGKLDIQTLQGKVIGGLAAMCQTYNKPLAVVCGALLLTPDQIKEAGITCAFSIMNRPVDEKTAFKEAFERVEDATFNMVRLFFSRSV